MTEAHFVAVGVFVTFVVAVLALGIVAITQYIITKKQIEELNRAHVGMKIVAPRPSCYAIWDTSNTYPVMKSEHVAVDLPEIVRCRDCGHFTYADSEHDNNDWCAKHEHIAWSVNGFCAWNEPKEGGE